MSVAELVERTFREEHGTILPTLIRILGDFARAEEALQEAFEAALDQWPRQGVPEVARAWIVQIAKRRAIDQLRRGRRFEERARTLARDAEIEQELSQLPDDAPAIADDQLRLVFVCCHPALSEEARVALTLRTVCGLRTEEIARAFLVPTPTMAQRIVRAQRKIREARIPFVVPDAAELDERVEAVLATVYLTFNEGYAATEGKEWVRVTLCEEAIRLGRVLAALMPDRAEVVALLSLMLLHHARKAARVSEDGGLVLLDRQDRSMWDHAAIEEGRELLRRALALGARGPYVIQAAIAALHAEAETPEATDWAQIAGLYNRLFQIQPSPVVALNRAAAVAMAQGAEHGLALIDDLVAQGALEDYHLLPGARADLLRRLGRFAEAAAEYERALALARNERERAFLQARLAEVTASVKGSRSA